MVYAPVRRVQLGQIVRGDVAVRTSGRAQFDRSIALLPQILVELAELQDAEVGDGTTSVVILAAELLKRANELVKNKIHPTNIIAGYRLAMREVCRKLLV